MDDATPPPIADVDLDAKREQHRRSQVRLRVRARDRAHAKRAAKERFPQLHITQVINEDWDKRATDRAKGKRSATWDPSEKHRYVIVGYHVVREKLDALDPDERAQFRAACELWSLEQRYERLRVLAAGTGECALLRERIDELYATGLPPLGRYFDHIQSKYGFSDREMDQLHAELVDGDNPGENGAGA